MFTLFRRLMFISLFFLFGCQQSLQTSPENLGYIQDLKTGQTLTPQAFAAKLRAAERILLGEQHDNLKHHQAQFWLLQQLSQQRPQGSLLMEMLSVDQQPLIAKISENPTAYPNLPDALNWKKSWNWAFYGDIVQAALQQGTALVATNLTAEEVSTLMQGAEPLNGYRSTEPQVKQTIADLITAQHGFDAQTSGQNQAMIRKMVEVQQFRDRRMAEKVLSAKTPSLLIAGNHHVNRRFGVPLHLADLAPNMAIISVLFSHTPQGYSKQDADYVWILAE